jgi:hypothetical protein
MEKPTSLPRNSVNSSLTTVGRLSDNPRGTKTVSTIVCLEDQPGAKELNQGLVRWCCPFTQEEFLVPLIRSDIKPENLLFESIPLIPSRTPVHR